MEEVKTAKRRTKKTDIEMVDVGIVIDAQKSIQENKDNIYKTCNIDDMAIMQDHYQQRIEYLEKLVRKYKFDVLTGLMGKLDFNESFEKLFEEYKFADCNFTLSLIDVNNLHNINRIEGSLVGDQVIKTVSDKLKELFNFHQIFRIGGDEFAVIIRESALSKKDIEEKLKTIPKTSFHTEMSKNISSPKEMYKLVDAKLTDKKIVQKRV